ncbi:transketolase [Ahrensia sp. R2A130]|uniref:transketolase n=1 Tax=Ahrensia sp. R2A130 TaxID=744979 RepID=UPI0001E08C32|nr:transketolase [Ahrensia sp. R2A130]EFL89536.1 putative transketolase N- section [Ahrensia sp. R2A130]
MSRTDLQKIAAEIRGRIITMCAASKSAHLASSLSVTDILTAAYFSAANIDPNNPKDPARDRIILSKGHAAMALYATLAKRGYFDAALLDTYNQDGALLAEHPPANLLAGVEAATGSLGHGLPIGAGIALANKIKKSDPHRTIVIMSDGECNEGSVWEAAMFAGGNGLDNLMVFVDYNKWQATARSNETLALSPLREKWEAFGWDAHQVDGHNPDALADLMTNMPNGSGKPVAIICDTVKGKGVDFMEDDNNWHYRVPKHEEVEEAHKQLGLIEGVAQ